MPMVFYAGASFAKDEKSAPNIEYSLHELENSVEIALFLVPKSRFRFACAYANPPKTVAKFADKSGATLTVNGGYWDADYNPTDLLIVNGKKIKKINTKNWHYGLFFVKKGQAGVRDLRSRPIRAKEIFEHAIKCGPTLVRPGGVKTPTKSTTLHARAAVGRDRKGNLFFALNKRGRMTYGDLSDFLLSKAVKAEYAFNLDGGRSVGYVFVDENGKIKQRRSAAVNSVIQVFNK